MKRGLPSSEKVCRADESYSNVVSKTDILYLREERTGPLMSPIEFLIFVSLDFSCEVFMLFMRAQCIGCAACAKASMAGKGKGGGAMTEEQTVLVANRGEIAIRVFRTAKAMGYKTVSLVATAESKHNFGPICPLHAFSTG